MISAGPTHRISLGLLFWAALITSLVFLRRFGDSLRLCIVPAVSPTTITGSEVLKAILLRPPSWEVMIFCLQICLYLLMWRSNTLTPPSPVTEIAVRETGEKTPHLEQTLCWSKEPRRCRWPGSHSRNSGWVLEEERFISSPELQSSPVWSTCQK